MKKILVIGSLNMDIVVKVDDMPLPGETILGKNLKYIPGGKGANQGYSAARLGGSVTMLGCVGQDEFGEVLLNNLAQAGVDISHMKKSSEQPTGTAIIYVNKAGDNNIVVVPGANDQCNTVYLKENDEKFMECDYVLLQMEIPSDTVYYAIRRAKQLGKTVILNPAPAPGTIPDDILKQLDYISPNETELAKLTNSSCDKMDDIIFASFSLVERGVQNILVTLGEKGVLLINDNGTELTAARKVQTVADTTAAGDCFNAAFAVALAEGKSCSEAILFANTASSIAVTRQGAQSSIPTREETDRLLLN
ncbi:MAG: ribokinase [Anaerocolumna sp.]